MVGAANPTSFIIIPLIRWLMARRRKMFKTISNVHVETVNDSDWSSFAVIDKQNDSFQSCYVDKVRISWIINQEETEPHVGFLWCASTDSTLDSTTASNNDGKIICASAGRGGAGVNSLDIKRRVMSNTLNTEGLGALPPIYLHVRSAEIGEATSVYCIVETWGRWHKVDSL